jgi:hypothetical protein
MKDMERREYPFRERGSDSMIDSMKGIGEINNKVIILAGTFNLDRIDNGTSSGIAERGIHVP